MYVLDVIRGNVDEEKGTISFQMIGLASVVGCLCVLVLSRQSMNRNEWPKKYGNFFQMNFFFDGNCVRLE